MFGALYFGESYIGGIPLIISTAAVPKDLPGTVSNIE